MEVMHSLPQIKPVRVRSQLIAGRFNLSAAKTPRHPAGLFQHALADPLPSAGRINDKFHDFRNALRVMQLIFKPQIQNPDYPTLLFTDKTIGNTLYALQQQK